LETLQNLIALANQGAPIVIQKSLPTDVPGLGNLEERRAKLKAATSDLQLEAKAHSSDKFVSWNRALLVGNDLNAMLAESMVRRESLPDRKIAFVRRRTEDSTIYFLVNVGTQPIDDQITLMTYANSLAMFDPMTGRFGRIAINETKDHNTQFYLHLASGRSCIVVASMAESTGPEWVYYRPHGDAQPLSGTWDIGFIKGGPELPAAIRTDKLGSWTELGGDAAKAFSGTAKYMLRFVKPGVAADAFRLDLGKVADSARVSLNGEELGVLISPPLVIDIPGDKLKDQNTLEISVSNLMANRIADMDHRNLPWKIFYNANVAAHDAANRGPGNVFSAANWQPRESGLIGPVMLTPLEKFDPLKGQ